MSHPTGPLVEKPIRLDHLEDRKKSYLSPDVHRDDLDADGLPVPKWKFYYARFMVAWAILSHSALLIQAIKIYRQKNADGVSLLAFILYSVSSVIWLVYGAFVLAKRNWVIVASSITAIALGIIIIVGVILYGDIKNGIARAAPI